MVLLHIKSEFLVVTVKERTLDNTVGNLIDQENVYLMVFYKQSVYINFMCLHLDMKLKYLTRCKSTCMEPSQGVSHHPGQKYVDMRILIDQASWICKKQCVKEELKCLNTALSAG